MTISPQRANRPFKWGERDRRQFITQDSEVAMRVINETGGNPIFVGRAKIGTTEAESKWQIRKVTYDSNDAVTAVEWPQDSSGNASAEYEFAWSSETNLTITGITQANPAVVTVSSAGNIQNGDKIIIDGVAGMTEVNYDGSNIYTVAGLSGSTFQLSGIDSSAFTTYSSGGEVVYGEVVNYTYS